jgi:hypothetical protein
MLLELIERDAGDRKRDLEPAFVAADCIEQDSIRGQITFRRDFPQQLGVFVIVEVMTIGVEDRVTPKPQGLMNLEVKAD